MIDPLERMRAANPVSTVQPPSIEALRLRIEQVDEPVALRQPPWSGGLPWRYRLATVASVLVAFAILLVTSGGSRHESSILAKAYAATDSRGVILHYRDRMMLTVSGRTHLVRSAEVWMSGSRVRSRALDAAGQLVESALSAHREMIYDASRNRITELTFVHASSMLSSENIPIWMSNPITALHSWYAQGRLRFARRESRRGRLYDVLISTGRPAGARPGTRVLVEAHTFIPVEISNRTDENGKPAARWTVHFSAFQRLPLTTSSRAELRLAPHPGATRTHHLSTR